MFAVRPACPPLSSSNLFLQVLSVGMRASGIFDVVQLSFCFTVVVCMGVSGKALLLISEAVYAHEPASLFLLEQSLPMCALCPIDTT